VLCQTQVVPKEIRGSGQRLQKGQRRQGNNLEEKLFVAFYHSTIESVLTDSITVRYASCKGRSSQMKKLDAAPFPPWTGAKKIINDHLHFVQQIILMVFAFCRFLQYCYSILTCTYCSPHLQLLLALTVFFVLTFPLASQSFSFHAMLKRHAFSLTQQVVRMAPSSIVSRGHFVFLGAVDSKQKSSATALIDDSAHHNVCSTDACMVVWLLRHTKKVPR